MEIVARIARVSKKCFLAYAGIPLKILTRDDETFLQTVHGLQVETIRCSSDVANVDATAKVGRFKTSLFRVPRHQFTPRGAKNLGSLVL